MANLNQQDSADAYLTQQEINDLLNGMMDGSDEDLSYAERSSPQSDVMNGHLSAEEIEELLGPEIDGEYDDLSYVDRDFPESGAMDGHLSAEEIEAILGPEIDEIGDYSPVGFFKLVKSFSSLKKNIPLATIYGCIVLCSMKDRKTLEFMLADYGIKLNPATDIMIKNANSMLENANIDSNLVIQAAPRLLSVLNETYEKDSKYNDIVCNYTSDISLERILQDAMKFIDARELDQFRNGNDYYDIDSYIDWLVSSNGLQDKFILAGRANKNSIESSLDLIIRSMRKKMDENA